MSTLDWREEAFWLKFEEGTEIRSVSWTMDGWPYVFTKNGMRLPVTDREGILARDWLFDGRLFCLRELRVTLNNESRQTL